VTEGVPQEFREAAELGQRGQWRDGWSVALAGPIACGALAFLEGVPLPLVATFAAGAGLAGAGLLIKAGVSKRPCKRMLAEPSSIVWYYTPRKNSVKVGLDDGSLVHLVPERDGEEDLMDILAGLAPGAAQGFSQELQAQFKQNPASLRTLFAEPDPTHGDPKATELRAALEAGNWKPTAKWLGRLDDHAEREFYVYVLSDQSGKPDWLDAWVEADPRSADALLMRGAHLVSWSWEARGMGWGHEVGRSSYELFVERLQLAEKDLYDVVDLSPDDPLPWSYLLRISRGLGDPQEKAEELYQEFLKRGRSLREGHAQYLQTAASKWGGETQAVLKRMMALPQGHQHREGLIAEAHIEMHLEDDSHFQDEKELAQLERCFGNFTHHGRFADRNLNALACALWLAGSDELACQAFHRIGGQLTTIPWRVFDVPGLAFQQASLEVGI
jgi:hypothetical protein